MILLVPGSTQHAKSKANTLDPLSPRIVEKFSVWIIWWFSLGHLSLLSSFQGKRHHQGTTSWSCVVSEA